MAASYITLGDKTSVELGFDVLKENTVIPGLPDTRDYIAETAGRPGAFDYGADLEPRHFMFACVFPDIMTPEDIDQAVEALNKHLLDNWGRPRKMALELSWKPGKTYTARYAGHQEVDATIAMARRRFMLPMVAFDPLAYGPQVDQIDVITGSPEIIEYEVDSGLNIPVTLILDNTGGNTINGLSFKTTEVIFNWTA